MRLGARLDAAGSAIHWMMKHLRIDFGMIFRLLKNSAIAWNKDNAMRLSAALSYCSVFSIAPLLLIAFGLVGMVAKWGVLGFGPNEVKNMIQVQLAQFAGPQVGQSVVTMVEDAGKSSGAMTFWGFFLLLFGASTVLGQLKEALNTIWAVRTKASVGIMGFVRERVLTFGLVFAIGFLLLISLALGVVVAAMGGWISNVLHLPAFIAGVFGFVLPLVVETLLFALLFQVLPDVKIRWRCVWLGAGVTALLFELGKAGLSWYLGQASTTSSFGAGASLVVLLIWVYYASGILFFGAEFTKIYAAEAKMGIEPSELAERVPSLEQMAAGVPTKPPVEPNPLHPNDPVPALPMKESLAPMLVATMVDTQVLRTVPLERRSRTSHRETWLEVVREHPAAQLGAALSVGLLIGVASRVLDRRAPALSASDHFVEGSRKTFSAGQSLLALGGAWVARHFTKKAIHNYGKRVQSEGAHWSHVVAERIAKAMH